MNTGKLVGQTFENMMGQLFQHWTKTCEGADPTVVQNWEGYIAYQSHAGEDGEDAGPIIYHVKAQEFFGDITVFVKNANNRFEGTSYDIHSDNVNKWVSDALTSGRWFDNKMKAMSFACRENIEHIIINANSEMYFMKTKGGDSYEFKYYYDMLVNLLGTEWTRKELSAWYKRQYNDEYIWQD